MIGDGWVLRKAYPRIADNKNITIVDARNVQRKGFSFGKLKAAYGRASLEYVSTALSLWKNHEIDCLVTGPVSKEAIAKAGFPHFRGQTEYLAQQTNAGSYGMMLLNDRLRITLVTRHIPLKSVSAAITTGSIKESIDLSAQALQHWFNIRQPRIVVTGVNPHASDNGLIGREEGDCIVEIVRRYQRQGMRIAGPLSADVAICRASKNEFDCVIAMYHDQALIPLKLLDATSGVNLSLGLPLVRTSPLHGTAFDIAGLRIADPSSFIASIQCAIQCSINQKKD
ncbi:MAG: 4-hydroxythreonine-4-phosphate dehydrogenase PdxA [Candidatus Omnitrophica bacterium]|nr:4-hydroxythreonine-4-phosphate dehydrogenase PdxA [Candidatus Omnitrophota bacterium]